MRLEECSPLIRLMQAFAVTPPPLNIVFNARWDASEAPIYVVVPLGGHLVGVVVVQLERLGLGARAAVDEVEGEHHHLPFLHLRVHDRGHRAEDTR